MRRKSQRYLPEGFIRPSVLCWGFMWRDNAPCVSVEVEDGDDKTREILIPFGCFCPEPVDENGFVEVDPGHRVYASELIEQTTLGDVIQAMRHYRHELQYKTTTAPAPGA